MFKPGDMVVRYKGDTNPGSNPSSAHYSVMHVGDIDEVVCEYGDGGENLALKNYGKGHASSNYKLVLQDWEE